MMGLPELTLIQKIAVWALPVIFAITVHEFAHGWVASKFGDQSDKML
ncbi:FIG004556: membrane metalloprotease, partial [hydrothermal vent metagenome]